MKKVLVFVVLLIGVAGCGSYKQTVQVDDNAYLLLIGEPAGNVIMIDDGKQINLADVQSFSLEEEKAIKIQLSIGSHTLKIIKGGEVTVHRNFYVSSGMSFEVRL